MTICETFLMSEDRNLGLRALASGTFRFFDLSLHFFFYSSIIIPLPFPVLLAYAFLDQHSIIFFLFLKCKFSLALFHVTERCNTYTKKHLLNLG